MEPTDKEIFLGKYIQLCFRYGFHIAVDDIGEMIITSMDEQMYEYDFKQLKNSISYKDT